MVYLTRTTLIKENKWREALDNAIEMNTYAQKDPLVVNAEVIQGITGDLNRIYWVAQFNSLADEEKWAEQTRTDTKYMEFMSKSMGLFVENSTVDNLFRTLS
jgi:hypothetical protein